MTTHRKEKQNRKKYEKMLSTVEEKKYIFYFSEYLFLGISKFFWVFIQKKIQNTNSKTYTLLCSLQHYYNSQDREAV